MASKEAAKQIEPAYRLEWVYWYPNGKKQGEPFGVMVLDYNPRNGFCKIFIPVPRKGGRQIVDGVPHISDKRLENPQAAQHVGGWELSEYGMDMRGYMREQAKVMISAGLLEPSKPGPQAKPKEKELVRA